MCFSNILLTYRLIPRHTLHVSVCKGLAGNNITRATLQGEGVILNLTHDYIYVGLATKLATANTLQKACIIL